MEETRHLASWIGGEEALHERVLTLDEALDAVSAVDAEEIRSVAAELFSDEARGWRWLPRLGTCAASTAGSACRHERHPDGDAATAGPTATLDAGRISRRRPRPSPGMGNLGLARAELEVLAGAGQLDDAGLLALAEALLAAGGRLDGCGRGGAGPPWQRWRSAHRAIRRGRGRRRRGRPGEAGRTRTPSARAGRRFRSTGSSPGCHAA